MSEICFAYSGKDDYDTWHYVVRFIHSVSLDLQNKHLGRWKRQYYLMTNVSGFFQALQKLN